MSIPEIGTLDNNTFIFRVESKIADAVCDNPRLIKLGMKFEFKDVLNRWKKVYCLHLDIYKFQN